MKYLTAVLAIIFVSSLHAETLVTDNFIINVESLCPEGHVTCSDIEIKLRVVGSSSKETIIGTTMHSVCADGVTPCSFQGYEFRSNGGHYILHASGVLEVVDEEGNPLLLEKGKWSYE